MRWIPHEGRVRRISSYEKHRCFIIQTFFDRPPILNGYRIPNLEVIFQCHFYLSGSSSHPDNTTGDGNHLPGLGSVLAYQFTQFS